MVQDSDEDRIRRKAHELWEADGRQHGRDQDHWVQAKEIIAIEDSQRDTLLARDAGAAEPIEDADEAIRNLADFPNLTDQGENLLTSTDREPALLSGGTDMPSVEVPTSDQPGVPANPKAAATKPDTDMKASPKNDTPPPAKAGSKTSTSGVKSAAAGRQPPGKAGTPKSGDKPRKS